MWKSVTRRKKSILSEAPFHGEDFQLTAEDLGEENQDEGQMNTGLQGDVADDQLDDQMGANPNDGTDPLLDDQGMDQGSMDQMNGGFTEPEIPEESEEDRLKKLILLKQYKALYERLSDVKFTLSYIKRMQEYKGDENIEYVEDQLEDIDEKINDTLAHHFLSSPYRDLLRLFYYLKYQTVALTDMLAKVTGASLDVSKNPNNKDKKKK